MPDPAQPDFENGSAIEETDERPLPVLAEVRPVESGDQSRAIEQLRPVSLPVAVAAATGGFVLGVATFVLVRILRRPRAATRLRGSRFGKRGRGLEVAGSRSFLVDVHLLKDR